MRVTISTLGLIGCALLATGCSQQAATTANATNEVGIANDMTMPMNDASAMESATNASIAPPDANMTNTVETPPLGETDGGDTGGTTVQSNVSGM
ncbi:MAG: hypothetical protein AB7O91_07165 [Sphingomonas sp.]